jgi:hypothetical protein
LIYSKLLIISKLERNLQYPKTPPASFLSIEREREREREREIKKKKKKGKKMEENHVKKSSTDDIIVTPCLKVLSTCMQYV